MSEIADIINSWSAKLLLDLERSEKINGVLKLCLTGEGGEVWLLNCKKPVGIRKEDGEADCVIEMKTETLLAIYDKRLNPQVAFLNGLVKVKGNTNLALKLAFLFE